jgi:hypothetical protein
VWCKIVFDICFTEFGTALTTILPILFQHCYKYCSQMKMTFQEIRIIATGPCITNKLCHIMLYRVWMWFEHTTLMVVGIGCIGSCKFNYHAITTTTAPTFLWTFIPWKVQRIISLVLLQYMHSSIKKSISNFFDLILVT